MPSIFDPPAAARTFNASDWLAAIDVQLQAPAAAPAAGAEQIADDWPTAEPAIDDRGPWETTQPAATPRRLRNLPYAMLAWLVIAGGIGAVGYTFDGLTLPLLIGLAVMTLELLIWLGLAWRFDRL